MWRFFCLWKFLIKHFLWRRIIILNWNGILNYNLFIILFRTHTRINIIFRLY
jgi:hypothetical protein